MVTNSPQRKLSRWKKWALALALAVIAYTVGGFFVAPAVIRSQATKIIQAETGLDARFEKIRINPYSLTLDVEGFQAGSGTETDLISLKSFHANLQWSSLFGPAFIVKEVWLDQPELFIRWQEDGSFNFDTVLSRLQSKTNSEPSELPAAAIGHLSISNAVVRWQDDHLNPGFTSTLDHVNLTLTNFHTLGTNQFVFKAALDSDAIIGASGEIALQPLKAIVSAGLDDLSLEKYAGYIPDWSPVQLRKALASGRLNVALSLSEAPMTVEISEGNATVSNFEMTADGAIDPVLAVGSVKVSGIKASLTDRSATIGEIMVRNPEIAINRMTNGVTDWQSRFETIISNLPASTATNAAPSDPFSWAIDRFIATNAVVRAVDQVPAPPVSITVSNAFISVGNLSPDLTRSLPIALGFELLSGGSGTLVGTLTPRPPSAELHADVKDVFFPIAQPYVQDILKLKLKNGTVSINGDAKLSVDETNVLKASYLGNIQVNTVEIHEETDLPFATVKEVQIDDLEIDWPIDDFRVRSVFVNEPGAHLYLREDGTVNVEEMVPASITEQIYQQLNEAWKLLQFEVDDVTITNGFLLVEDHSISPFYQKRATSLYLNLVGLKPKAAEPARLNIAGVIAPSGPFSVVAEFSTRDTNLVAKVAINAQMIALSPESPYAGKFLGHLIDDGDVSLDLRYELNGVLVKGENRVIVNSFEFGKKTDSKDAVSLPVKLGVSLLKDADGKIDLDVPVEGDIRDPEFKLGKVIWSAFSNLFTKAITAPFKFLGRLVGAGDDEDLGAVQFAAGQTELTDIEKKKVRKLSQALNERPALRLEIVGRFDPAADAEQLRSSQFEKALADLESRVSTDQELHNLARTFPNPAKLDRDELVQLLYVRTYGVDYSTPAKPPADLIARKALEQRTQSKVAEEPELLGTSRADGDAGDATFWDRTKNVLTLKPLVKGNKTEVPSPTDEPDVTVVTPATSKTAEIIVIDEPIPVLPALPSVAEMEAKLKAQQTIDEAVLAELANERAEAVRHFIATEAGIEESRLQIAAELSGPEPATAAAKVFLGIY